jgi:hypothetical protein
MPELSDAARLAILGVLVIALPALCCLSRADKWWRQSYTAMTLRRLGRNLRGRP